MPDQEQYLEYIGFITLTKASLYILYLNICELHKSDIRGTSGQLMFPHTSVNRHKC